MKTTTIDSEHRATIPGAVPKQKFWIIDDDMGYRLHRIPVPAKSTKMTREEVINAIQSCKLKFPRDWDEMRAETREP